VKNKLIPSLLIPEIYFPEKEKEGVTSDLIEKFILEGFYRSFEIADIVSGKERKQIGDLARRYNVQVTQWLPSFMNRKNLDLSSLDSKMRSDSIQQMKESLYSVSECGASSVAIISGKEPGGNLRGAAMEAMFESVSELCEEADKHNIKILIESIDYKTDKRGLLGPIASVLEMIDRIREHYENIGLVFDTAHTALNNEDIFEALSLTRAQIRGIHLSNAVLDQSSDLYGDNHIPIGEPGFLTEEVIKQFLVKAAEVIDHEVNVAIEVRSKTGENCSEVEKIVRSIQCSAMNNL
jgi:hydroxypyruvate isomerase